MGLRKSSIYQVFFAYLALGWVLGEGSAHARQDLIPGSRYTSGRAAALGDAFLPLGEDGAAALFYNPAAIGKLKGPTIEPLNLSIYGDLGYFSSLNSNFFNIYN